MKFYIERCRLIFSVYIVVTCLTSHIFTTYYRRILKSYWPYTNQVFPVGVDYTVHPVEDRAGTQSSCGVYSHTCILGARGPAGSVGAAIVLSLKVGSHDIDPREDIIPRLRRLILFRFVIKRRFLSLSSTNCRIRTQKKSFWAF